MERKRQKRKQSQKKLAFFMMLVFIIFAMLSARLFYLQVVNAQEYQAQSEENKTRFLSIPARRGDIIANNG